MNHRNGRKTDNRPTNLEYTSRSANLRHAYGNGLATAARGERHGRAKLTERQVRSIRAQAARGLKRGAIARLALRHGVARETIHDILARRRWAHMKEAA